MPNAKLKIEHWPLTKLAPYPNNPRDNDEAIEKMVASLGEFGFRIPIIARSTGEIVDGHLRYKAALKIGMKTVPVTRADELSDAQIKAFRLTANYSSNWANWNAEMLEHELHDLEQLGFDVAPFGLDDILPELQEIEELDAPVSKRHRSTTTIFVSIKNEFADKARKAIIEALNRAKVPHNL
jgi:ParB-like chromosome segregation protein Spo0J